jgi:AcrR family transcriptional regulator
VPAVTPRGRQRRERLLHATASLVAERGFHAVGIAEIGAAAGVSGSAIYRHFGSKEEMLVALVERVVDELHAGARDLSLTELVDRHIAFAVRDTALITVWSREAHHLPDDDRRRLRRKQRAYVDVWANAIVDASPGVAPANATAAAHAVLGLVHSVAEYDPRLPRDDLVALLTRMAHAALTCVVCHGNLV